MAKSKRAVTPGGAGDGLDPLLVGATSLLCLFGILMVYSSSAVISMKMYGDPTRIVFKQLLALAIGSVVAIGCYSFDYRRLRHPTVVYGLLGSTATLLIAALLMPVTRGTRRWLKLGSFSFEPSEVAKVAVVIFLAYILEKKRDRVNDFVYTITPISVILGTFALLILVQPDFGTAAALLTISGVVLFSAGLGWGYVGGAITLLMPIAAALVMFTPYRVRRLLAFLSPWEDPQGYGFQPIQALIALGSGGLTGLGPGESVQKLFYLPEPHTDFVFAVVGEEFGLIGGAVVLAVYLLWTWRGIRVALRADNDFGFYLATGLTSMVTLHYLVNMSVALSLLPTKGLPLPFISAGGSSLIVCMAATGLLLNVSSRH